MLSYALPVLFCLLLYWTLGPGLSLLLSHDVVLPTHTTSRQPFLQDPAEFETRRFTLRHIYHRGTHEFPRVHRYVDVRGNREPNATNSSPLVPLPANTVSLDIRRMRDRSRLTIDHLLEHAATHGAASFLAADAWTEDTVSAPDPADKETVLSLSRIAANAYSPDPTADDWIDIGQGFNHSHSFGWEMDGLRGHVFADDTNSTIVIGFKGTTMAIFDGEGTTGNDKDNDNLFGSCCCGEGGQYRWKQVCSCMTSAFTCNQTCVVKELHQKDRYYAAARDLYHHVIDRYPTSEVWLSGHSLGGVVAALLGLTYGLPVMTFEAYPDALAASRLGLPVPPGYKVGSYQQRSSDEGIYHYGHTADPVFMGSCNSKFSSCSIAGYAMEGICHTGRKCQYDTVNDLGWRVGIRTHSILSVIPDVLERYDTVPACEPDLECQDCYNWKFFEGNRSIHTSTTSSSSTETRTRSEICQTPGWWGCRDGESSTTKTSSSSEVATTSCKTPGWFGCLDPTTTTAASTVSKTIRGSPVRKAIARKPHVTPAPTTLRSEG